ncbi:MAG TPA: error-prone DNA polymerase [Thermoanaerobaculia bacterium]|nr:error-prone DNA polymerase [Thermoanaerobaculia bacterium]
MGDGPRTGGGRRAVRRRYAELRCASSFSFLAGASLPEDLVERAAELELPAVALVDRNGVYGAPRFYKAARAAGIKALVGAEVVLDPGERCTTIGERPEPEPAGAVDPAKLAREGEARITLLVADRSGYQNLCRLLTAAALAHPKGEARVDWDTLAAHAGGLVCLTGGEEGPLARTLRSRGPEGARRLLERLRGLFPDRLGVELQRHALRSEEERNQALGDLARSLRLPLLATNGVRYARADDKRLHDVLTCIRLGAKLDSAGALLDAERQRHLKGAGEMAERFRDCPEAVEATLDLARGLDFTLADLGYRFPDYPVPPGETPASYLRQLAWNGARARFRPLTARAQAQIERELALIEKLQLEGYFLIVWDIVRFCQDHGILVQGRGSAANSAVCYALSITAVDPVKMELLFERFLSEERGEWPDIDLDLPSGAQREQVIQYVYRRYGVRGAAMTANVITYRDRMAAREVAKVLGYSEEQVDTLAKQLGSWGYDVHRGDAKEMGAELRQAGFDPVDPRIRTFAEMWWKIQNLPRHLGQHSGGMVIAAGRLDEVVPLEPAAMEGRVVVQWDKDDCADLGIIKVDLLGLGMLCALEEAAPMIHRHEGLKVDYAHLPPDDPAIYRMLQKADTVGLFQVESRAQMASLPRHRPTRFYDLVIQIAIIRPGPIVGQMANPFFERRLGREPVTYPHPSLEPILERTLGVPIFQEQILKIAMVAAGFSGGEAEELRRAMGFKRSMERMDRIERRLRAGMTERGIEGQAQDAIVKQITSFALYGFPESHSASFALIAYASAYLKAHHPTAFYAALLNAWPMGFYHPATLLKDAARRGVEARPIDVNLSGWKCRWEPNQRRPRRQSDASEGRGINHARSERRPRRQKDASEERATHHARSERANGALRLGLRFVKGLRQEAGEAIEREQAIARFTSPEDLARRAGLREGELTALAHCGALGSLGLTRRQALWQAARVSRTTGPLHADHGDDAHSPLPEMTALDETVADFAITEVTTGPHPMTYWRERLTAHGVLATAVLERLADGRRVRTAGSVIVRQRPGTAKGLLFVTVEDETGMVQAMVTPQILAANRRTIVGSPALVIEGKLQQRDGSLSIRAERLWPLESLARIPSHDFR